MDSLTDFCANHTELNYSWSIISYAGTFCFFYTSLLLLLIFMKSIKKHLNGLLLDHLNISIFLFLLDPSRDKGNAIYCVARSALCLSSCTPGENFLYREYRC